MQAIRSRRANCFELGVCACRVADVSSRTRFILLVAGALIVAGGLVLWIAFATDVVATWGQPIADLPYGRDLRSFTAAGEIAAERDAEALYDSASASYVLTGAAKFVNPPWYAIVMIPFAWLPFQALFPIWGVAGIFALSWSLRRLGVAGRDRVVATVLMSMAAVFALYFGQNTFFMVAILTFGIVSLERGASVTSGVAIALLGFKPHLLVGIAVWWLADFSNRWRAILAVAATSAVLVLASALWLPGSWAGFVNALREPSTLVDPDVEVTLFSAIRLLTGSATGLAIVLFGLLASALVVGLVITVRTSHGSVRTAAGVAITVSVLLAVHGLPYDWLLLVVAGGLVVSEAGFGQRRVAVVGVLLGSAMVFGDFLTELQLGRFPIVIHAAPWILLGVTVWMMRTAVSVAGSRQMPVHTP